MVEEMFVLIKQIYNKYNTQEFRFKSPDELYDTLEDQDKSQ